MFSKKFNVKPLSELISLNGERALVTGSAMGIGKAIASRFAEAGANLELVDVNEKKLKEVKEQLSEFDVNVNIHNIDLSKKEEIDALWSELDGKEPSILVNNAGIYPFISFLKIDGDSLKKVLEINLNSIFWMCRNMIERRLEKGGVIINVSSIEAMLPFKEDLAHYSVSKAGVIALTRALAKEYGKHNFRVNVIMPGGIMTPGVKNIIKEIFKLKLGIIKTAIEYKQRLPLGRFGKQDEVACMALVLASDISSYVHGASIPIDGGFLSA
jgi:NAD(P)-dependent dehydrogenase (short-subunit alcohol dehydrogenase family)